MKLLRSLIFVSLIIILSRILGFARDIIIVRIFGIGASTDAFFVAFKLPNLLRRIFAEGTFSQIFIPILAEYKINHSKNIIKIFISYTSGLLTMILSIVVFIGVLTAPWIIMITAPGFINTVDKFILTTQLLRITFPYAMLISLSSLLGAILNTWNIFSIPAFSSILLNTSIIFFAVFVSPYFNLPIISLAWAIMVGGVLQILYQLPYIKKIDMLVLPRINFFYLNKSVSLIKKMGSAILGVSIGQISIVINTIFASFLVSGSVSWMYYADRLVELPSGILGAALGTILLPSLSENFIQGNYKMYSYLMDRAIRICFLLAMPSSVALVILAKPLIVSLFQYDKFTSFDSIMTQHALVAHSIGLIGLILVKILTPGFYSRKNIKTPVKIAIFTFIITQVMNLIFINLFKHAGLSLSIGLSACLNAAILYWQLIKQQIFKPEPGWICFLLRLLIAVFIMSIALIGILYLMPDWLYGSMFCRLMRLMFVISVGIIVYFLTLIMLGLKFKEFIKIII